MVEKGIPCKKVFCPPVSYFPLCVAGVPGFDAKVHLKLHGFETGLSCRTAKAARKYPASNQTVVLVDLDRSRSLIPKQAKFFGVFAEMAPNPIPDSVAGTGLAMAQVVSAGALL